MRNHFTWPRLQLSCSELIFQVWYSSPANRHLYFKAFKDGSPGDVDDATKNEGIRSGKFWSMPFCDDPGTEVQDEQLWYLWTVPDVSGQIAWLSLPPWRCCSTLPMALARSSTNRLGRQTFQPGRPAHQSQPPRVLSLMAQVAEGGSNTYSISQYIYVDVSMLCLVVLLLPWVR